MKAARPPTRGNNFQPKPSQMSYNVFEGSDQVLATGMDEDFDVFGSELPSDAYVQDSPNAKRLQEMEAAERPQLSNNDCSNFKTFARPPSAGDPVIASVFLFAPKQNASSFKPNMPKRPTLPSPDVVPNVSDKTHSAQGEVFIGRTSLGHLKSPKSPQQQNESSGSKQDADTPPHNISVLPQKFTEATDQCSAQAVEEKAEPSNAQDVAEPGRPSHNPIPSPSRSTALQQNVVAGGGVEAAPAEESDEEHIEMSCFKVADRHSEVVIPAEHNPRAGSVQVSDEATVSTSPVFTHSGRRGSVGQNRRSSTPKASVQSARYRVSKKVQPSNSHRERVKDAGGPPEMTRAMPSEDDLFSFVLQRLEQQKQERHYARAREEQLKLSNDKLHKELESTRTELDETQTARSNHEKESQRITAHLEEVKRRYGKLKQWAVRMNMDFDELSNERIQNRLEVGKLKQASLSISDSIKYEEAQIARTSNEVIETRNRIAATAANVDLQRQELDGKKVLLAERDIALQQAELDKLDMKNHIARLQGVQERANKQIVLQQDQWIATLGKLCRKIHCIDATTSLLPTRHELLEKSLDELKTLWTKESMSNEGLASLERSLSTLGEKIEAYEAATTNSVSSATTTVIENDQKSYKNVVAELKQMIDGLHPEFQELFKAKQELATLEERVKGKDSNLSYVDDRRKQAEARENGHLKQIADMCNKFASHTGQLDAASNLRNQLSQKTMEWNSAKSELAKVQSELQTAKIVILGAEAAKDDLVKIRGDLKDAEALHGQLGQNNERLQAQLEDQQRGREQMEKEHSERVEALQAEVNSLADSRETIRQELQAMNSAQEQTSQKLQESQSLRNQKVQECKNLRENLGTLEAEVADLRPTAARAQVLSETVNAKVKEIQLLRSKQVDFEDLAQKLSRQEHDSLQKSTEIQHLKGELEKVSNVVESMKDIQVQLDNAITCSESLQEQLKVNQVEANCVKTLQQQLISEQKVISELESKLQDAQKHKNRCEELQSKADQSANAATELQKQLEDAQEELGRLHGIEMTSDELREEVDQLKTKLVNHEGFATKLKAALQETQQKDSQIQALQDRVVKMETESQRLTEIREYIPDEMVDEFFDQVDLSIPSMRVDPSQVRGNESGTHINNDATKVVPQEKPLRTAKRSATSEALSNVVPRESIIKNLPGTQDILLSTTIVTDSQTMPPATEVVPDSQNNAKAAFSNDREQELVVGNGLQHEAVERDSEAVSSELSELSFVFEKDFDANDSTAIPNPASYHLSRSTKNHQPKAMEANSQSFNERATIHLQSQHSSSRPASSTGDMMLLGHTDDRTSGIQHSHPSLSTTAETDHSGSVENHVQNVHDQDSLGHFRRPRPQSRVRTPMPSGSQEGLLPRAVTPLSIAKERHQPNSAAKRDIEPGSEASMERPSTKRLKRNPGNLDLKIVHKRLDVPRPDQPQTDDTTAQSPAALGAIRAASVVGTNAPTPKGTQKKKKPSRKGSRQDRYADKFSQSK